VNTDAMVEAALPSTLARLVHLLFAVPYPAIEAASTPGGVVERVLVVVSTLVNAHAPHATAQAASLAPPNAASSTRASQGIQPPAHTQQPAHAQATSPVVEELVKADALHLLFSATTIECSVQHRKLRDRVTSLVTTFVKLHTSNLTATYLGNKVRESRYILSNKFS